MQMTMSKTAGGRRPDDIGAPTQLTAWVSAKMRIGWISLSRLMRECMTDVVTRAQPVLEIAAFETARDCVTSSTKPLDLIIYHSRGNGVTDTQELTELRMVLPSTKLLVMLDSAAVEPGLVQRVLDGGASGFILTADLSLDMLLSAIRLVGSGGTFVSREVFMADRLARRPAAGVQVQSPSPITQRERSVLELIKRGKPNKTIAKELGLSVCTVKIHTRNVIRKMGVANRTEAAVHADDFLR